MNANSVEVSLSFAVPSSCSEELKTNSDKLIAEFSNDDVILGLGSLRQQRLGVAFFLTDPSHQQHYTSMIERRVYQTWPGAQLLQAQSTPVSH